MVGGGRGEIRGRWGISWMMPDCKGRPVFLRGGRGRKTFGEGGRKGVALQKKEEEEARAIGRRRRAK